MTVENIRKRFISFFENRGHVFMPSSSLLPKDQSVLFTTAGMQQFKNYFTGELDPIRDFKSKNTVSIQKCFRTSDIDEVGDESHLTFFEMLGNFSFGGYFKHDAIKYAYDFITKEMNLSIDYVTVFDPEKVSSTDWRKGVGFDFESYEIWKNDIGILEEKIHREGIDNFWGPTGVDGPCGPTTEIYVKTPEGKAIEIWNIVFNEFFCDIEKKLSPLPIKGVDTGMGLERLTVVSQKVKTIYETDIFKKSIELLPPDMEESTKRIFADHSRAISFLISDGVIPSNKGTGYVLRRLLRRLIVFEYLYNNREIEVKKKEKIIPSLILAVCENYKDTLYEKLSLELILNIISEEEQKFLKTLEVGLKELSRIDVINEKNAFKLYESYGIPFEIIKDLGGEKTKKLTRELFEKEFIKHQEISRAGVEKKFGGHGLLLDTGELKAGNEDELKKVLAFHTATHLLHRSLRELFGDVVTQRGSDITSERARFDFSFPRKLTPDEIKNIEDSINEKIKADMPVSFLELKKEDAEKTGALHFFNGKYPDRVKVYFISPDGTIENAWSKEFCNGPHVPRTGIIPKIHIAKEESVSSGVRRIRLTFSSF